MADGPPVAAAKKKKRKVRRKKKRQVAVRVPVNYDVSTVAHYHVLQRQRPGSGGFVFKVMSESDNKSYALQRIPAWFRTDKHVQAVAADLDKLYKCDHPQLVRTFQGILEPNSMNLVSDVADTTVEAFFAPLGTRTEKAVGRCLVQVLNGLEYLNTQGLIHGNLCGNGVVVTGTGSSASFRLFGYGVTPALAKIGSLDLAQLGPYWLAPEVCDLTGTLSPKSDIWSLACLAVQLLTGSPPYFGEEAASVLYQMARDDHPALPPGASAPVLDFLKQCFKKDPNERPSLKDLKEHEWLKRDKAGKRLSVAMGSPNKLARSVVDLEEQADVADLPANVAASVLTAKLNIPAVATEQCAGCGLRCTGYSSLLAMGKHWHLNHFKCHECAEAVFDYVEYQDKVSCVECVKARLGAVEKVDSPVQSANEAVDHRSKTNKGYDVLHSPDVELDVRGDNDQDNDDDSEHAIMEHHAHIIGSRQQGCCARWRTCIILLVILLVLLVAGGAFAYDHFVNPAFLPFI